MKTTDLAHLVLTRTARLGWTRIGTIWDTPYAAAVRRWGDAEIATSLHGRAAVINFANPYPLCVRRYPNYNAPQVELVALTANTLGHAVRVLDVGAAVGDTALLLLQRCGPSILSLDCIEGDERFFRLLERNLEGTGARAHHLMLSDREGSVPSLVRSQHQGTASAQGANEVQAVTLDSFFTDVGTPDVIKVDTDGYDGKVLGGASRLLQATRPSVLFEWHPRLCHITGTDDEQAFSVLRDAGYSRFIFFTKFGQFSHFGDANLDKLPRALSHQRDPHGLALRRRGPPCRFASR